MIRVVVNVARNDLAIVRTEPAVYAALLFMPVLLMAFLRPLFGLALHAQGHPGGGGAELAVPGLAVMFSFYLVSLVGYSMLQERQWHTWTRLTDTGVPTLVLVGGKALVPLGVSLVQQGTLFTAGVVLFGLPPHGSLPALAALAIALDCCVVGLGLALATFATTAGQVNVFGNVSTLLFAGFGGALTPTALLPGWARAIAPMTPSYWAVDGFHQVLLSGSGLSGVAGQVGVLLAFAAGFAVVAGYGFSRRDERRAA